MPLNSTTPAGPPPSGVASNFINPQYDGGRFVAVGITFLSIAIIMMAVRLYTQIALLKRVGLDDYLMLLATLLSIAMSGLTIDLINYGLGKHIWDVPQWQFAAGFFKINLFAEAIYSIATAASKVSILLLYLRIFPCRNFRLAVWAVIFVVVGYGLASVFANLFRCLPMAKSWDPTIVSGSCIDKPALYYANSALETFTDFLTLLVPILMLRSLKLPLKQKIFIGLMLIAGSFICIASLVRIGSIYNFLQRKDYTYAYMNTHLWSTIELNTTIAIGSIPPLNPLAQHHIPHLLSLPSTPHIHTRNNNPPPPNQGSRKPRRTHSLESPYIGTATPKSFTNVIVAGTPHPATATFPAEKFGEGCPRTGILRTMGYRVEEEDYGGGVGGEC